VLPNDSAVAFTDDPVKSFLDRAQWLRPRIVSVVAKTEHPVRKLGVAWVVSVQCAVGPGNDGTDSPDIILELAGNGPLPADFIAGPWPAPSTLPSLNAVEHIFGLGPFSGMPTKGLTAGPQMPPDATVVDWEAHVDVLLQRRVCTPDMTTARGRSSAPLRRDRRAATTSLLDDEFRFIGSTSRSFHSSGDFGVASAPWNVHKNRYVDVMAPDATRVQLVQSGREGGAEAAAAAAVAVAPAVPEENRVSLRSSTGVLGATGTEDGSERDYINASYISGAAGPRTYIAAQGPKGDTLDDFWRLVWQQRVKVIVMLTRCQERGVSKCAQYWPVVGTCVAMGNYVITHVQEARLPVAGDTSASACTSSGVWRREFRIDRRVRSTESASTTTESRIVVQLQYTQWPDKGVPETVGTFYDVVNAVEAEAGESTGSVLVHCSAGIGRSGTFIVVHSLLASLLRNLATAVDHESLPLAGSVVSEVLRIRRQRPGLVQTKEQLLFCYLALAYCLDSRLGGDEPDARVERDRRFALLMARVQANLGANSASSGSTSSWSTASRAKLREVLDRHSFLTASDERGTSCIPSDMKRRRLDHREVSSSGESSATA
jgi:protein tyrosine phosphatase